MSRFECGKDQQFCYFLTFCGWKLKSELVFRILNLGKVTKVPKLNQDKAIEEGAQLLSEMVILSIAAGLVTFEYRRSSEKEEAKQV